MIGDKKVWSCSTFLNENDILEIRINENWDYVDKFIILEAGQTHTGNPKPFNFDKERFKKYSSKLIYETIETCDELIPNIKDLDSRAQRYLSNMQFEARAGQHHPDWVRDHQQGNHHVKLLQKHGASPKDLVVITPVDEILSAEAFRQIGDLFLNSDEEFPLPSYESNGLTVRPIVGVYMKYFFYKLNLLHSVQCCAQVSEYSTFLRISPTVARSLGCTTHGCLQGDTGWHFSGIDDGTGNLIHQKYTSWAHSKDPAHGENNRYYDMNTPEKAKNKIMQDFGEVLEKVEISPEHHPAYLIDNQEKFKHLMA